MVFRRKQITSWNDDDSLSYVCALSSPSYLSFLYDVTSLTSYASSHYMSKVDYLNYVSFGFSSFSSV